jgi:hypothetical protein
LAHDRLHLGLGGAILRRRRRCCGPRLAETLLSGGACTC